MEYLILFLILSCFLSSNSNNARSCKTNVTGGYTPKPNFTPPAQSVKHPPKAE